MELETKILINSVLNYSKLDQENKRKAIIVFNKKVKDLYNTIDKGFEFLRINILSYQFDNNTKEVSIEIAKQAVKVSNYKNLYKNNNFLLNNASVLDESTIISFYTLLDDIIQITKKYNDFLLFKNESFNKKIQNKTTFLIEFYIQKLQNLYKKVITLRKEKGKKKIREREGNNTCN